ncbi:MULTISPECIES: hypothetical protein [Paenibacillus]|uniref:Uncharacterized protein n=2 Tax=Paenibacillus TaxID=44249 RepID=A0ABX2ZE40_PAEPO|nr:MULTISPECIES: hypothetical protein [Paenibacillus]MDR6779408.1 hypothetical protein [Paenibacillus peoriae]ODA08304.1 hypothetical protein A7312_27595 [Paenibacillus polymyxa]
MIVNTGRVLKDGTLVELGDKLQGSQTREVVVLWDEDNANYGVEVIGRSDFWWELDYYLSAWSDLKKTGNINKRL